MLPALRFFILASPHRFIGTRPLPESITPWLLTSGVAAVVIPPKAHTGLAMLGC